MALALQCLCGMNRRDLLELGIIGSFSVAFGGRAEEPRAPRTHVYPDAPAAPALSRVGWVHAVAYSSLARAVRAAIDAAGGLGFIAPGQTVMLNPATIRARPYPATADPEVALIVAQLVQEAGGTPFIADRTMFLRSTRSVFAKTGMLEAAQQLHIACVPLDDEPVARMHHPLATSWPRSAVPIYRAAAACDHLISLCTPRTHKLGDFTMALKNNVGLVAAGKRLRMHAGADFKKRLAEISLVARPSLVLLDGRLGFGDGGPDEGALVRPGFIAASRDPVAIDALGLAELRLAGCNDTLSRGSIWGLPLLRRAVELGLGAASAAHLEIAGATAEHEAQLRSQMM